MMTNEKLAISCMISRLTMYATCISIKGQKRQRFRVIHLKELTQTNHLHLQSHFSYHTESGLNVEKSSKTTDTKKRTIFAATNQKPASICTLEKYHVTESTAGSAVITKESQSPSGALRWSTMKWRHCSSRGCSDNTGSYSNSRRYRKIAM